MSTYNEMLLTPDGGAVGISGSPLKQSRVVDRLNQLEAELSAEKLKVKNLTAKLTEAVSLIDFELQTEYSHRCAKIDGLVVG